MVHRSIHGPIQDIPPETLPGFVHLTMSDNPDCAAFLRRQFASQDLPSSTLSGPNQALKAVMPEIMQILNGGHINPSAEIQLQFLHDLVIHPTRENSWLSLTSILPALPSFSPPLFNQVPTLSFGLLKLILDHITDHGEHIPKVYACLGILLRPLKSSFWTMA